jgi:hypothetical protein
MPHDEPPPVRPVEPDELLIRLPEERVVRESFELVRDHWWSVKEYAETRRVRGVAIVDRLAAERQGGWPPHILRYLGQEYGVAASRATFANPAIQARMDQDPRCVRVLVLRGVPAGAAAHGVAVELLFHLDRGPAGVQLASGDRHPGAGHERALPDRGERRERLRRAGLSRCCGRGRRGRCSP